MKRLKAVVSQIIASEEFELSFTNGVESLPWFATLIQRQNWRYLFQKSSFMDDSHDADAIGR